MARGFIDVSASAFESKLTAPNERSRQKNCNKMQKLIYFNAEDAKQCRSTTDIIL